MQKSKELIKVNKISSYAIFQARLLTFGIFLLYFSYMTKNIFDWPLIFLNTILKRYYSMHPKIGCLMILFNLLRFHSWCYNVSYMRLLFWQICCKVHFFPPVFFLFCHSWKTKFRSNSISFYKINHAVLIKINLLIGFS